MAKLEYTSMGELIVYRLCWPKNGHKSRHVFPTHKKALNYLHKCKFNHACIEAVFVFPGKTDRERIDAAYKLFEQARRSPGSVAQVHLNNASRIIQACS